MQSPNVRTVDATEAGRTANTLLLAFASDPVSRWGWKDPDVYVTYFPAFLRAFGGAAFAQGTSCVAGDFDGAALWLPPGAAPDMEPLLELLGRTVPEPVLSEALQVFGELMAEHPSGPHWHLAFLGVDPSRQGQGAGSALLKHTLRRVDEEHLPAYLESSNPKNVPLYMRHGFEVVRELRVGSSPPLYPMIRAAR